MEKFKEWLSDAYWHWRNVFYFRFNEYNDGIDRGAFFEELNYGWYQMYIYPYDDWYNLSISKERKLFLGEDVPTIYLSEQDFDAIVEMINSPPKPSQGLIDLMNRKSPWED